MTGPAHYREAEELLGQAFEDDLSIEMRQMYVAAAQVHATLASAAAQFPKISPIDWTLTLQD